MNRIRKFRGFWTLENCLFEAKKYKSVSEWKENSGSSYVRALKMGWRKRCVMHMPLLGSKHKRLVYVYEFPDKSVYVGLTYNPSIRRNDHLINPNKRNKSSVYKHIQKTKLTPTYVEISEFISFDKASELEISTVERYKKSGFKILNKKLAGSLGGNILKWSKENCINDAIKYKTKGEWQKKSVGAYRSALKNNWIDDCCNHMIKFSKPNKYWTKERCLKEAKKYGNKWYKKSHTSYVIASRNKWF